MFSVVIPLFNKAGQIISTLESVAKQTEKEFEVIIVDDGSTDKGHEVVLDWISKLPSFEAKKYQLLKKNNGGVSSARNYGINRASYDFVAFLDADDLWQENHLHNLRALINDFGSQVDVFSNALWHISDSNLVFPKLGKYEAYRGVCSFREVSLISNGFLHSSSVCVRRDLIYQVKFPKGWDNLEDVITWMKVTYLKGFAFDSERTCIYRTDFSVLSKSINFDNYILFEIEMWDLGFSFFLKLTYLIKFLIIHFMYAKLVDERNYFKQAKRVVGRAPVTTFCYLFVAVIPAAWLKRLKNSRKNNQ